MPTNRLSLVAALAVTALVSACGSSAPTAASAADGRLTIVTTVAPITSIVSAVAGDRATVTGLVPEGTNSHTFDPPPSAAAVLSKADVVFINGLKLEEPTKDLAASNLSKGSEIVELGTLSLPASDYIYDFSFPKAEGKPNPHLWTDPLYAIKYAQETRDVLVRRDPANSATYTANTATFVAEATALSEALKTASATVPQRELLTYHDAYAYFAKDYGWTVLGAVQPANFEDPTPKEVAALIDQIRAQKVPTIFGSEVFPSKVLEQVAAETGARYEDTLRDDDLPGKPGDADHSWLGLMRYDYVTMVTGLGGDASALKAVPLPTAVDKADYPQ